MDGIGTLAYVYSTKVFREFEDRADLIAPPCTLEAVLCEPRTAAASRRTSIERIHAIISRLETENLQLYFFQLAFSEPNDPAIFPDEIETIIRHHRIQDTIYYHVKWLRYPADDIPLNVIPEWRVVQKAPNLHNWYWVVRVPSLYEPLTPRPTAPSFIVTTGLGWGVQGR